MVTGIFRANNPLNTFLLFMYGLIIKFGWLIHPHIPEIHNPDEFLFNNILQFIKPIFDAYPTSYSFVVYGLLFTQAVSFNHFITSRRLMQKPNYLPAMCYLLITSFFLEWNVLSAPLVINTFLIWIWAKMSNLNNNQHVKTTLFNIGLAIGICSFLYFPSLAFTLLIMFGLLITRPLKAAEWLMAFLGIATTWYFLFSWLFLTGEVYSFHLPGFHISYPLFAQNSWGFAGLGLILVAVFTGGLFIQSFSAKQLVQVRKGWALMVLYFLVALFIPFITISNNFEYWLLATVPAAAFAACAFFYPRIKWVPMVFQWVMVGFVFYMQYLKY